MSICWCLTQLVFTLLILVFTLAEQSNGWSLGSNEHWYLNEENSIFKKSENWRIFVKKFQVALIYLISAPCLFIIWFLWLPLDVVEGREMKDEKKNASFMADRHTRFKRRMWISFLNLTVQTWEILVVSRWNSFPYLTVNRHKCGKSCNGM